MGIKDTLSVKSMEEIRADYLAAYSNGLINRGVAVPNVSEGTEAHIRATAIATIAAEIGSMVATIPDALMPDTSTGDDLLSGAASYGILPRDAGPSAGSIVFATSQTVGVVTGAQLLDITGQSYLVSTGGSYSSGDLIPIVSAALGRSTNLPAGSILRWTAPPPFSQPTALVSSGGLTGGADAEGEEDVRARWLDKLGNPPNSANAAQWILVAEQSHPSVQKAFVYQAVNGPSTLHVAVTTAPTATNRERDVPATFMATIITPKIQAELPAYVASVVTTVTNVPVDVSFGFALPSSTSASPPGPGGGWVDGNPFPVLVGLGYVPVVSVGSSISITLNSDLPPVAGYRICWLSSNDWILRTAAIVSYSGAGPYSLTLDSPFVDTTGLTIQPGDYVFPAAENMGAYISSVLEQFARLGPGQKTTSPGLLPRAYRVPAVQLSWPSDLTRAILRPIIDSAAEIEDIEFLYRSATTPGLPASVSDPPKILVPRRIGIYPVA